MCNQIILAEKRTFFYNTKVVTCLCYILFVGILHQSTSFSKNLIFSLLHIKHKKSFFWLLIQQKFIIIYAVQRLSYISILCYKNECRHVSTTYVFGPGVNKWKHLKSIESHYVDEIQPSLGLPVNLNICCT